MLPSKKFGEKGGEHSTPLMQTNIDEDGGSDDEETLHSMQGFGGQSQSPASAHPPRAMIGGRSPPDGGRRFPIGWKPPNINLADHQLNPQEDEEEEIKTPFSNAWPQTYDTSAQLLARRPPPVLPVAKAIYTEMMAGSGPDKEDADYHSESWQDHFVPPSPGRFGRRTESNDRSADRGLNISSSRVLPRTLDEDGEDDDEGLIGQGGIDSSKLLSSSDPYSGKRHLFHSKTNREGYKLPSIISGESLQDLALHLDTLKEKGNSAIHKHDFSAGLPSESEEEDAKGGYARSVMAPSQLTSALGSTATLAMLFDYTGSNPAVMSQYVAEVIEIEDSDVAKMSFFQSLLNSTNFMVGVGTLSIPYFCCNLGWFACALLMVFAVLTIYTGLLIGWCLDVKPEIRSFPDLAHAAYGRPGRWFTAIVLYCELLLCLCVFLVIIGEGLHNILPSVSLQACVVIAAAFVVPTCISKDMTIFSYFSIVGLLCTLGAVIAFTASSTLDIVNDGIGDVRPFVNKADYIPVGTPAIMFLFSGHAIFPSVKTHMREPHKFSYTIFGTYLACISIGMVLSVIGYLRYGAYDESVPNNLLHIFQGKTATILSSVVVIIIPFCKFGLCLNPVACAVEEVMPTSVQFSTFNRKVARIVIVMGLVTLVTVVACVVPFLDLVEGLVGAMCSTCVAVIIPVTCSLAIRRKVMHPIEWPLCIGILVVFLGVLVMGTGGSLNALYNAALHGK